MKAKKLAAIALGAVTAVSAIGLLAGCGGLQAKGPQYEYTVIDTNSITFARTAIRCIQMRRANTKLPRPS